MNWPISIYYVSFALALFAVAVPILLAHFFAASERLRRWARWYRNAAVALALGTALVLAGRYLVVARPFIEGIDFFFYVCVARDILHGAIDSSLPPYVYFPGVYRFWELVMALFGEELSTLQWAFVGVLAANALLVAAIVAASLRSVAAGGLAALWYLALASRFEGLYGTTEPIATLFALTGLLCWGGMPLRGAAGWRRALLLGAGLGLALWMRQQGGLVAIGAAVLVVTNLMVRSDERHSLTQIAVVPLAAAVVFLGSILLEGQGLLPLRAGLAFARQYEGVGSHFFNVRMALQQMGFAGWGAMFALLVWTGTLLIPRMRHLHREPSTAIVGFALIASLATWVQFAKRPYLHYALLAAPFLAIAVVVMGVRISRAVAMSWPRAGIFAGIGITGALAAPIIASAPYEYFHVWPPSWHPRVAHEKPWHLIPGVAADLHSLGALLPPGTDLLVLPPRRVVVHFLLGTRSISLHGYGGWDQGSIIEPLMSPTLDAVLILDRQVLDPTDIESCVQADCNRAISALPENGFSKIATLKTMTLWRRLR